MLQAGTIRAGTEPAAVEDRVRPDQADQGHTCRQHQPGTRADSIDIHNTGANIYKGHSRPNNSLTKNKFIKLSNDKIGHTKTYMY